MGMAAILVMRPLLLYTHWFPLPIVASYKNLALISQAVSEKKMFEYYDNIHVHVCCPGVGADVPMVFISFQNH